MKIVGLIMLLVASNPLFASYNLEKIYKDKGIEVVQNELEKRLENKQFWEEYLQDVNTTFGYFESIEYTLVCKADMKTIDVFKNTQKKKEKVFQSTILTGKITGGKTKEGDLKTPLGVYSLTKKLPSPDQFYGPLALVTNYPNTFDKIQGNTGSGIWIHGLPLSGERDPYTKGCIALENQDLVTLDKSINFSNSIVLIQKENINSIQNSSLATILANIYSWKNSWKNGDFENYISFYSENFKKLDGTNFERFKQYKKSIFAKNEEKQIIFKDINILPYPNEANRNIFYVQYFQNYTTKSHRFTGQKELYIELIDDKIQILYEG